MIEKSIHWYNISIFFQYYDVGAKNRKKKNNQRENERKAIIKKFKKIIILVAHIVDNIITRASVAITTARSIVKASTARIAYAYKKNDYSSAVIAHSTATAATANIATADRTNISAIIKEDSNQHNNQLVNIDAIKI